MAATFKSATASGNMVQGTSVTTAVPSSVVAGDIASGVPAPFDQITLHDHVKTRLVRSVWRTEYNLHKGPKVGV